MGTWKGYEIRAGKRRESITQVDSNLISVLTLYGVADKTSIESPLNCLILYDLRFLPIARLTIRINFGE